MDISNNPIAAYWQCSQADKSSDLDDLSKAESEAFHHLEHVISKLPTDQTPEHRPLPLSPEQRDTYDLAKSSYLVASAAVAMANVENKLCEQRYTVPPRPHNPLLNGLEPPK
jgi:hypothetical protein